MSLVCFLNTDYGCKGSVRETRRKMSSGEPFLPFSAAQYYSQGRPRQPAGDRQQPIRRNWLKSDPVRLQVKFQWIMAGQDYNTIQSLSFPKFESCVSCCFSASPSALSVRVMLYQIYQDVTEKNLETMKFLLSDKLGRRHIDTCRVRSHPATRIIIEEIMSYRLHFFFFFPLALRVNIQHWLKVNISYLFTEISVTQWLQPYVNCNPDQHS